MRGAAQRPDSYCKECRREVMVRYRAARSMQRVEETFAACKACMPITDIADRTERLELIRQARAAVMKSKLRRQAKRNKEEDARTDRELAREEGQRRKAEKPELPQETKETKMKRKAKKGGEQDGKNQ